MRDDERERRGRDKGINSYFIIRTVLYWSRKGSKRVGAQQNKIKI